MLQVAGIYFDNTVPGFSFVKLDYLQKLKNDPEWMKKKPKPKKEAKSSNEEDEEMEPGHE